MMVRVQLFGIRIIRYILIFLTKVHRNDRRGRKRNLAGEEADNIAQPLAY